MTPGFVAHQEADPATASRFTQGDAGIWSEKLLTAATERRVHVVFETTMRTPDNVEKVMTAGRSAGYRVEARVLAVSPRISWQGCHYRFEEMHHTGAAARIPPRAVHDAAVTGLTARRNLAQHFSASALATLPAAVHLDAFGLAVRPCRAWDLAPTAYYGRLCIQFVY